jgi:hypothetical protein
VKFTSYHAPTGDRLRCEPYEIVHYDWSHDGKEHRPHYSAYVRIEDHGRMLFGNHVDRTCPEYATTQQAIRACEKHAKVTS